MKITTIFYKVAIKMIYIALSKFVNFTFSSLSNIVESDAKLYKK